MSLKMLGKDASIKWRGETKMGWNFNTPQVFQRVPSLERDQY